MRTSHAKQKRILVMAVLILLAGAAAFIAGRMLNNNVSPLGVFGLGGKGGVLEVSINMIPAKELATTSPEIVGLFAERTDNTIFVQSTSLKTGGHGIAVQKDEDGDVSPSLNMDYGHKVEVVLTNETVIYRDTTQPVESASGENVTVHQMVEESSPDDLTTQSFVSIWGRKSGDRIIADVVLINAPVIYKSR